ncbi:MAG: dihydropteroate synthase [Solirubrobacterales bacterium]
MASTGAAQRHTMWKLRDGLLGFPRPLGVGIVNVTDDSFFEGARSGTPHAAIRDGLRLTRAGFDMLDIGAVAAAPGPPVPAAEEIARLIPAIEGILAARKLTVMADTFVPEVARRAVEAGAAAINDTGGGRDPEMLELVAESGSGLVMMHIEGPPREEREPPRYDDVVAHLREWFAARIADAVSRGVREEQIALDPGLDFDLSLDDDIEILMRLAELHELGRPLFISLSRKDLLGAILAGSWEERAPARDREWATGAAVALAAAAGAEMFRLHDRSALDAMRVAHRIANG